MLEMKPACEKCSQALGHEDGACICSFECTFCPECATALNNTCPNCGGELLARPKRCTAT